MKRLAFVVVAIAIIGLPIVLGACADDTPPPNQNPDENQNGPYYPGPGPYPPYQPYPPIEPEPNNCECEENVCGPWAGGHCGGDDCRCQENRENEKEPEQPKIICECPPLLEDCERCSRPAIFAPCEAEDCAHGQDKEPDAPPDPNKNCECIGNLCQQPGVQHCGADDCVCTPPDIPIGPTNDEYAQMYRDFIQSCVDLNCGYDHHQQISDSFPGILPGSTTYNSGIRSAVRDCLGRYLDQNTQGKNVHSVGTLTQNTITGRITSINKTYLKVSDMENKDATRTRQGTVRNFGMVPGMPDVGQGEIEMRRVEPGYIDFQ